MINVIYLIQFLLLISWGLLFFMTIWIYEYRLKRIKELKELYKIVNEYEKHLINVTKDIQKVIDFPKVKK